MVKLRVVAERAGLRDKAQAFHRWKMESLLEQKAMDIRQANFLITNAKLEVQKSKTALQTLYKLRDNGKPVTHAST